MENQDLKDSEAGQSQDPKKGEKKAKAHFREHTAAIRDAATKIGVLNHKLKDAQPNDKDDLHREMDTQVAQLHLAVNNAHDAPDENEIEENTGGAASTEAVDPNVGRKRKAS